MNPHLLIMVEKEPEVRDAWKNFTVNLDNKSMFPLTGGLRPDAGSKRLSENIWLIPLKSGLPLAGEIQALAKQFGLPCKALYLDGPPAWILLGGQNLSGITAS